MKRAATLGLALALASVVALAASAESPVLCGSSGCVTVSVSASRLVALFGSKAAVPPPPIGSFFKLNAGAGEPIYVVPSGSRVYLKRGSGDWRLLSRSEVQETFGSFQGVTAYAAPNFTSVQIAGALKRDTTDYKALFGRFVVGGKAPTNPFAITLISPQANPWSKTKLLIDPRKGTAQIGGKTYVLPKSLAERIKRDLPAKQTNEPDWEALLIAGCAFVAFLVSLLQVRYRRRAARRDEPSRRPRVIGGVLKIVAGVGFVVLVVATASGSLAVWLVLAGLILVTSGLADLLGRERVGFWVPIVPILLGLAVYLARMS